MSGGWLFALGVLTGEAMCFVSWLAHNGAQPFAQLSAVMTKLGHALVAPSWKIGGELYRPRRLTRSVMEQVAQTYTTPNIGQHPLAFIMMGQEGPDQDEMRATMIRDYASKINASYETCSLILENDLGVSPSVELLSDELTLEQTAAIITRILG